MNNSNKSALRDATKKASLDFYEELEDKTLYVIDKLESYNKNKVTAELVKKELGINYQVLGRIFTSLGDDGAVVFYVSPDKSENYSPKDMIVRTTNVGKSRTRRVVDNIQRRSSIW